MTAIEPFARPPTAQQAVLDAIRHEIALGVLSPVNRWSRTTWRRASA